MKVELCSATPNPVYACGLASSICTASDDYKRSFRSAVSSGHDSVLEHAVFTFEIRGISRVCAQQLTRHRLASYSQLSQRYVAGAPPVVLPSSIRETDVAGRASALIAETRLLYDVLIERGVPAEDARFILPEGSTTDLVVTMNARELLHFFELRLCSRAQWEIRELAEKMLALLRHFAPEIFARAGPPCIRRGACPEARPCRREVG